LKIVARGNRDIFFEIDSIEELSNILGSRVQNQAEQELIEDIKEHLKHGKYVYARVDPHTVYRVKLDDASGNLCYEQGAYTLEYLEK